MGKRKHVPTDLHSELSEYSSLIRALRTSNTLDLSTQLTLVDGPGTQPTSQPNDETYEDDEDENLETADAGEDDADVDVDNGEPALVEEEDAEDDVSVDHESNSRRKAKGKARAPATVRDTWTKWPLVPSEVHVPEWPFDEEVRLLAQGALRRLHPAVKTSEDNEESTQVEEADGDEDTEEDEASDSDDELPAETVHSLARATAKRLYEILGAASVMLPKGEDSMQNRHGYINWELVLSAVDAFGLYTPEYVALLAPLLFMSIHKTVFVGSWRVSRRGCLFFTQSIRRINGKVLVSQFPCMRA